MSQYVELHQRLRAEIAAAAPGELAVFDAMMEPFEIALLAAGSAVATARYSSEDALGAIRRAAELMTAGAELLSELAAQVQCAQTLRWMAEEARKVHGEDE